MKNKTLIVLLFAAAALTTCKREELPKVDANGKVELTVTQNSVNGNSAMLTCNVSNIENYKVSQHGFCWNTTGNPTTSNAKTELWTLGGVRFSQTIENLIPATTYYVKAYIVIQNVTIYSKQTKITTTNGTVTDIDGNTYITVTIGNQVWMAENLKTTHYNDGTAIPNVTDGNEWAALTTGAYCWYSNATAYKDTYGALYNWYAVNTGKLAPTGWHVATDAEWTTLTTYLGGESVAGGKLKETDTTHWASPNTGATNETGFTALPGGYRGRGGAFGGIGGYGYWWSATEFEYLLRLVPGHVLRLQHHGTQVQLR
ncbi:MAG: fibrobacter succinogenes major paralogous domain-containing protein [Bacteroidales bacterium]|nr:fibrobacter succinogenes major paralogous domain-containing protein [Bacteroidales bacterium]